MHSIWCAVAASSHKVMERGNPRKSVCYVHPDRVCTVVHVCCFCNLGSHRGFVGMSCVAVVNSLRYFAFCLDGSPWIVAKQSVHTKVELNKESGMFGVGLGAGAGDRIDRDCAAPS